MKILIPTKPCDLITFYNTVAREMGHSDPKELEYDCRKINVASNIQDNFYIYYTNYARETQPELTDNDIKIGISITLMMSGPKVDSSLKANEVEVFEGFICNNTKLML